MDSCGQGVKRLTFSPYLSKAMAKRNTISAPPEEDEEDLSNATFKRDDFMLSKRSKIILSEVTEQASRSMKERLATRKYEEYK